MPARRIRPRLASAFVLIDAGRLHAQLSRDALTVGRLSVTRGQTLFALRAVETTVRNGVSMMTHAEKLSDELLLPNLDQDMSSSTTRRRNNCAKRFARYAAALDGFIAFFGYIKVETELLERIKAERER